MSKLAGAPPFAGLLVVAAGIIAAGWWWLGRPVPMPTGLGDPGPIQCVSYAPFRDQQSPFDLSLNITAAQVEEDLGKIAAVTKCIRTYAFKDGAEDVAAAAERLGIKVMQGMWLGRDRQKNRAEIDATVALAKRYPNTISSIIVGNEVLLRGELSPTDLGAIIAEVKSKVSVPVTYADVWEFWERNRDLMQVVDFVTIHILPYWEDFPIPADHAGAHVDEIRSKMAAVFPGKEILIGEVGWPSQGRMREGALPSPSNQARVLEEVMVRARAGHYRVNLIEGFDQPWKRRFEGTAGAYWGLFSNRPRVQKFAWGEPVSDHPWWRWQLAGGILLAGTAFASAALARRSAGAKSDRMPPKVLAGLFLVAVVAGVMAPWTVENASMEGLGLGGLVLGAVYVLAAIAAPLTVSMALAAGIAVPPFARTLGRPAQRPGSAIAWYSGLALVLTTVLAVDAALGLVFDPRYRDLTFAPMTAAFVPFAVASLMGVRGQGPRGTAETVAATALVGSAVYIVLNESFANWEALWFGATLVVLAFTLLRLRDAQST